MGVPDGCGRNRRRAREGLWNPMQDFGRKLQATLELLETLPSTGESLSTQVANTYPLPSRLPRRQKP